MDTITTNPMSAIHSETEPSAGTAPPSGAPPSGATPSGALPSGPRADATRAAIIETAERLFRTLGYRKTTVADIARELGMSSANVYRFFPTKSAINEAIAARLLAGLTQMCWTIARGPGTATERLRALYRTLQQQTIALFFNEKRMHDMVAAALEEQWSVIKAYTCQIEDAMRQIIVDGEATGEFAPLDPDTTAKLLHFVSIGFTHPTVVEQCAETSDLAAIADGVCALMLRALRPNVE